ncbi:MAG: copper homeostasis protein CutC [Ferruginibacter sp.]
MNLKLEVIGFTIEGCVIAENAGAFRIELCDNPGEGGTTPSYGFIKAAREKLSIELYPIIRPRGGDFFYNTDEFEIMKSDISICKELGCDGVVTGILNADGTIDKKRNRELVELAYPMGVTFHRAFDRVCDATIALEDIIETGFERILSSGLLPNAANGAPTIAALIKQANGRIIIMPGSGVRSDNIIQIAKDTGATEFHSSARNYANSKMEYANAAMNENLQSVAIDEVELSKMIEVLRIYSNENTIADS